MENFIVGLIVAAALGFTIRSFVRMYKGEGECGCGSTSNCSGCASRADDGCAEHKEFICK
ncbi:MAG: FeoB-associated Cys-rich membrane protein [Desulfobacterales bacterium]|nr:FeoB-associated Cys-rich membrane protein [Desulfobacterales bacterium]